MAGAFHGIGEPECVINVGVSGPGVVCMAVKKEPDADFGELASIIKRTAFKVTRMGELVGRAASEKLAVPFGIVDLSLAPTPAQGDSVARILEAMGLERVGTHGSTAALALLNDAVKKGGAMASSYVGGLSGAFIPVSEDEGMIEAAMMGAISIDKLEAMTCVCSVGLDMIAVPGDTPASTIAAIIADEAAIGMINAKTTAVRIIPAPGRTVGDVVEFGGLLGTAPVMARAPLVERGVRRARRPDSRRRSRGWGIRLVAAGPSDAPRGSTCSGYQPRSARDANAWWIERSWTLRTSVMNATWVSSTPRVNSTKFMDSLISCL